MKQLITQWHETGTITEGDSKVFIKRYEPSSYEIRNEASWLTSIMLQGRKNFAVPIIKELNIVGGYIKMECADDNVGTIEDKFRQLITCAIELHGLIQSDNPHLRTAGIYHHNYIDYLLKFTEDKLDLIPNDYGFEPEVKEWILGNIKRLHFGKFTIVHRDLRLRHLLLSPENKPTLIDWEFSNISEPAQDLAKLIFDGVVNHGEDFGKLFSIVLDQYSQEMKISKELLRERIIVFLPIIPLEHIDSFLRRKPYGYTDIRKK